MPGVNKVMLIGHIGKDPELRFLTENVAVLSFPMVTTEVIVKNAIKTEFDDWHNVVMWRSLAQTASKCLKKGFLVCIQGKMKTRSFMNRDGKKSYVTEVIADQFTVLGLQNDRLDYEVPPCNADSIQEEPSFKE